MSEIIAPRGVTSYPLVTRTLTGPGGTPQAGNTVEQSVQDPSTGLWLNLSTGAWQASQNTLVKPETQTGVHLLEVNLSQADAASRKLISYAEVTAGPLAGLTDIETIQLDDSPTAQQVWEYVLAASAGVAGSAAETLVGAGGGFTPSQVAAALLQSLTEPYEYEDGTVGQALHAVDATTLRRLLMAAIGHMTRIGAAYKSLTCFDLFVGDMELVRAPVLKAGSLADLTGASVSWNFTRPDTGVRVTVAGAVSATPGHAEYVTTPGDGIVDQASTWRAQAIVTLADSSVKASPIVLVNVEAIV